MGFLDDAIQASKEEEERATERAREYEERERAKREGTLRDTFEADFGRQPARVDPGAMTATLEGLTLHLGYADDDLDDVDAELEEEYGDAFEQLDEPTDEPDGLAGFGMPADADELDEDLFAAEAA